MECVNWIESSLGVAGSSLITLPSLGHIVALVTVIGIWKYPRADAFDRDPRSSSSSINNVNPMFTPPPPPRPPPPPKDPPPPPARRLSTWECDESQSSSNASTGLEDVDATPPPISTWEPSSFLKSQCPDSTPAERHRFLVARNGNEEKALENLLHYTQWRKRFDSLRQQQEQTHCDLQFDDGDLYDWIVASQTALLGNDQARGGWQWLPPIVRTLTLPDGRAALDRDGRRILHMTPALIDDGICSLETYSLAIALYLDRKLSRESMEKMTILMDLRPGEGWRNISAVRLLPFIKSIVGLLLTMFPERLHKSVLYPLPLALTWVFGAVKAVIDPVTAAKLVVLSGSAGQTSPLPLDKLTLHVSREVALLSEKERLATFCS